MAKGRERKTEIKLFDTIQAKQLPLPIQNFTSTVMKVLLEPV